MSRQPEVDGNPTVETPAYVSFASRILAAGGRRVARGDIGSLAELVGLRSELENAIYHAVRALHTDHGYSWSQIAAELGITKQAAQQRYGDTPEP